MKKFLSIVAILALVMALSVSAFAAGPADLPVDSVGTETTIGTTEDGETVVGEPSSVDAEAAAAIDEIAAADGYTVEIYDIRVLDAAGADITEKYSDAPVTISVAYDFDGTIKAVYVLNAAGKWEEGTVNADGTVTLPHLSPVAFLLEKAAAPAATGTTAKAGASTKKSPQTGYNVALLSVAAVAMALCAGYCFTRKVTE